MVSKIAIINPYLLRGLTQSSEVEACMRFIVAAKNLGIEAKVFKNSQDVYDFNPDFVIPISHQEPKLTHYPTYGLLINPLKWALSSERFARNLFSYDGYFIVSPHILNWLQEVCSAISKPLFVANAAFSVPQTTFTPANYANAKAAYLGVNWDGLRHFDLFNYFADGEYLQCFGPTESWRNYPAKLYGGMIPFDGFSSLKKYAECGIGLGINHADMDEEGIPTCRTFEIPASGAVAICAPNKYIKANFGDTVLYVDKNVNSHELAAAIKDKINWVRSNPKQAEEMARAAHEVFNSQLSLEFFIKNMIAMHEQVIANNGFPVNQGQQNSLAKITYFIYVDNTSHLDITLDSIRNQTYPNINTILLAKDKNIETDLQSKVNTNTKVAPYTGIESNPAILQQAIDDNTRWVGFLNCGDKIFQNHCSLLLQHYQNSQHDKCNEAAAVIFSSNLEHSKNGLRDKIQDMHMLYLSSNTRIGNISPSSEIALCSTLFKFTPTMLEAFYVTDFSANMRVNFGMSNEPLEVAMHVNKITSSAEASDEDKSSVLLIENVTSPLNFTNNYTFTQGSLLLDERQKMAQN